MKPKKIVLLTRQNVINNIDCETNKPKVLLGTKMARKWNDQNPRKLSIKLITVVA